jgi:hypothetical protein
MYFIDEASAKCVPRRSVVSFVRVYHQFAKSAVSECISMNTVGPAVGAQLRSEASKAAVSCARIARAILVQV